MKAVRTVLLLSLFLPAPFALTGCAPSSELYPTADKWLTHGPLRDESGSDGRKQIY
jgi:hypothetical protein